MRTLSLLIPCLALLLSLAGRSPGEEAKAPAAAPDQKDPAGPPPPAPVPLFPVAKEGKWGYIDKAGKLAIAPQFEGAWDFSEGLACVQVKKLRGYIDPSGKLCIEPKFALAYSFHDGLAAVMSSFGTFGADGPVNHGQWAYIDKSGKIAIPAKNPGLWAGDFHEGIARYKTHGSGMGTHVYIDRKGGEWQSFTNNGRDFSEGLAAIPAGSKYGFKNLEKKYVIEPQFADAGDFHEGLAPVCQQTENNTEVNGRPVKQVLKKWGFIDQTGKFVIEPAYDGARSFGEGLAPVAQVKEVEVPAAGGKTVKKNELRWGYVNKEGKLAVEARFEFAAPFAEGLGRVAAGGRYGFIDKEGKTVVEPKFDAAWEFSQGLARVIAGDKEGYINPSGAFAWEPSR